MVQAQRNLCYNDLRTKEDRTSTHIRSVSPEQRRCRQKPVLSVIFNAVGSTLGAKQIHALGSSDPGGSNLETIPFTATDPVSKPWARPRHACHERLSGQTPRPLPGQAEGTPI